MLSEFTGRLIRTLHRRRLYEIAIALLILAGGAYVFSSISPYDGSRESSNMLFYESDSDEPRVTVMRARIIGVENDTITVTMLEGQSSGDARELKKLQHKVDVGDVILVSESTGLTDQPVSYVSDIWRLPTVLLFILLLALVAAIIGRRQGLMSLVGLSVGIAVVAVFVIPQILNGANPFQVCIVAVYAIAVMSLLVAHGFKRRTIVSIIVVLVVLTFVVALSLMAVAATQLSGMADDAAGYLSAGSDIDLRGVLMGSILIATLGVLDDVVTTQVATVDELMKANADLSSRDIYHRALSVGGEHIAAVINTLALAYVGVALPTLLSIAAYHDTQGGQSLVAFFNSEFIAQEVVRTVVSSIGLIIAVPLSTYLAVVVLRKWHAPPHASLLE